MDEIQYCRKLEEELETFLAKVEGVGQVEVLIYMKTSPEYIVEKDTPVYETSRDGESESSSETRKEETTVYTTTNYGEQVPFVSQTRKPQIEGMVIAAEGAANESVRIQLVRSAMALKGIQNKIRVGKKNHRKDMVLMKKLLKKNQIMITALAIMIAVAGYLNFAGAKIGEEDFLSTNGSDSELTYDVADISDEDMYAISLQEEPDGSLTDITSMDTDDTTLTSDYLSSNMQIEGNSDDSLAVDSTSVNHGVLSEGEDKADAADAIDDEVEVPGEAVFTSTTAVSNLDGARLLKEQTIAKNKATLLEIINNENLSEAAKQEAIDSMLTMTQTAQKETDAQMLLEAKGYADTVVSINNGTVDVMVNAVSLTDAQTAQIMDIVQRKTDVSAENIIITVSGTTP